MAPNKDFPFIMDFTAFASVNIPTTVVSISINIFLVFCMVFPQQGTEQLKQPLNILLGSLVGYNTALQVCVLLYAVIEAHIFTVSDLFYAIVVECICFTMRTSVTSHLWLNMFYHCQIVPAQHPFFVLLKKNMRFFIYSSLILDKFFFLFEFSVGIAYSVTNIKIYKYFDEADFNLTYSQLYPIHKELSTVNNVVYVNVWLRLAYFFLSLCLMLVSSSAVVLYLWRHMKSMEESSSNFSSPRLQRQIRVTITGIIQIVLYFLCSVWIVVREVLVCVFYLELDLNGYIFCTVICLYSWASTINLIVGQTIFRQRVIHALQTFLQSLKFLSM